MSPPHFQDHHELTEHEHRVEYPAIASLEDLKRHRVPLGYRDLCSAHLIKLNQCKQTEMYLPWKCHPEKHNWEVCQYKDFLRRMRKATRLRAEAKAEGTGPVRRIDQKLKNVTEAAAIQAQQPQDPL